MNNGIIAVILKLVFFIYFLGILIFFLLSSWSKKRKILFLGFIHIFIFSAFILYIHHTLKPIVNSIKMGHFYQVQNVTFLRDKNNIILGRIGHYNREYVPLKNIPPLLIQAIITVEDEDFFAHRGLSLKNIFFNLFRGIFTNKKIVGASTITQQVAKNIFLSNEISFKRKFKEMWLAINLSKYISKEEILEIYVNHIFFGETSYGIKSASKRFFHKQLEDLHLNEMAFLTAIIKGPSYFLKNPQKALERQNYVLKRMHQAHLINNDLYNTSLNKPVCLMEKSIVSSAYDHIKEDVKKVLMNAHLNPNDGYHIYVTIEPRLQNLCFKSLNRILEEKDDTLQWRGPLDNTNGMDLMVYKKPNQYIVKIKKDGHIYNGKIKGKINDAQLKKYQDQIKDGDRVLVEKQGDEYGLINPPVLNGVIVIVQPKTGKILAMVGGRGLEYSYINGMEVIKSMGSVAKLIPLITALEGGYPLNKEIIDAPIYINEHNDITVITEEERALYRTKPGKVIKNHDNKYSGKITLEDAIIFSKNIPMILLTKELGMEKVGQTAKKMELITANEPFYLASSLGALYTNVLNIVRAFAVIPNRGIKLNKVYYIERIEDINHQIIFQENTQDIMGARIFTEDSMNSVTTLCKKVARYGIRNKLDMLKNEWSCKTGTAQDNKEAAFIVWNDDYIIYVMVYSMDNMGVDNLWGSTLPLYIAREILKYLDDLPI